ESTDDDVTTPTDVKDQLVILVDDEADDDLHKCDKLVHESMDEVPHSDESDDRPNEYDLSDSFIDDGPLNDEPKQDDSDSDN
ncbi:hypothetical protein Tco_0207964, partial [Tanacetum coccineum]